MTDLTPPLTEDKTPVIDHLIELRRRLIQCVVVLTIMTVICYMLRDHILAVLIEPLNQAMGADSTHRLIYTSLTEAFFTALKISFLTALFITLPFILMQIWKFVAPGLYAREQGAFLPFLIATPVLFVLGGLLVYFGVMPLAWKFFLGFQTSGAETILPIQLEPRIGDYLSLILTLIFAFGLCFQLPVFLMLIARAGFISAEDLSSRRKYAVVAAFVIAAVLTPPDVISQTTLAVPIILLYETSIFLIRRMERERALRAANAG
jgi:sec-independent protein translocase protein TatC